MAGQGIPADLRGGGRQVAEALGWQIEKVNRQPHPDYASKGKEQVELVGRLQPASSPQYLVRSIETKRTQTRPNAPFITATLQQAASTQLYFGTQQDDADRPGALRRRRYRRGGPVGLITYMRTDSTNLSAEAVAGCAVLIGDKYGPQYVPEQAERRYKSQDECPGGPRGDSPDRRRSHARERSKGHLAGDQCKLYDADLAAVRRLPDDAGASGIRRSVTITAETRSGRRH